MWLHSIVIFVLHFKYNDKFLSKKFQNQIILIVKKYTFIKI